MSDRAAKHTYFQSGFFTFFRDLARHNDRDWFLANKPRYEALVRQPLLAFTEALGSRLKRISSQYAHGRVMRINRDLRFSADKSPYRTSAGVMFGHADGGNGPSPGFYVHLSPDEVFVGSGLWAPDSATQNRIRNAIVDNSKAWRKVTRAKGFPGLSSMEAGDSLKRPPRGFDPEHEFIEDLKRKHFITTTRFNPAAAAKADFLDRAQKAAEKASPLVRFLSDALGLAW